MARDTLTFFYMCGFADTITCHFSVGSVVSTLTFKISA